MSRITKNIESQKHDSKIVYQPEFNNHEHCNSSNHGMKLELEICNRNISEQELLDDIVAIAKDLEKENIKSREYDVLGKYSSKTLKKRFGSWNNALEKAGLTVLTPRNVSEYELFMNLKDVWVMLGKQPKSREMRLPFSKYTIKPYTNRFGTWREALGAFANFIKNYEGRNGILQIKPEHKSKQVCKTNGKKKTKRDPSPTLRLKVLNRDNYKCCYCGNSPSTDSKVQLEVDHIIPYSREGETVLDNLQTLCKECNRGKSNKIIETYFR